MGGGQGVMIIHLFLGLSLLLRAKAFTTSIDYHLLPRFYIPSLPPNLSTPTQIPLSDEQSQHALSVLRLSSTPGRRNLLRIFNQVDGEWLARVVTSKKNAPCMIELQSLLRPPPPPTQNPSLYFAPVGPKASKQVLVMGTELGVKESTFLVSTEREICGSTTQTVDLVDVVSWRVPDKSAAAAASTAASTVLVHLP